VLGQYRSIDLSVDKETDRSTSDAWGCKYTGLTVKIQMVKQIDLYRL